MSTNGIIVQSGELVAQRLFDVAWSIQLGQAEQLWSAHLGNTGSRSRLTTTPAKALSFGVPPLLLNLEPVALDIDGVAVTAQASARLYDFGVVVLSLRVPIVDLPWPRFAERFNALERCVGATSECAQWARLLQQLRGIIAPAFQRPSEAIVEEDYLLGIVHSLNEPLDAASLPERVDLAGLLSGDQRPLSAAARRGLLQRSFSYFE